MTKRLSTIILIVFIRCWIIFTLNPWCHLMLNFRISNVFLIFSFCQFLISGSDGDEREEFIKCVELCSIGNNSEVKCNLNFVLKLTGWDCLADCKYQCMQLDVAKSRFQIIPQNSPSKRIVQYYGKWPFLRIFGAQEIFSVIFSLGNLIACLMGYFKIYKHRRSPNWMKRLHLIGLFITCNTWIQSSIFHFRDTPFTEKLDYFSACLCILSTGPIAIIRVFEIRKSSDQLKVIIPIILIYFQHISYMTFVKFDYGYNVKFNAIFGVISNSLWLYFAFKNKREDALKFVIANILSMLMVTIDFPPFFQLIDIHSLWHLSTIPITLMWYKFISK